MTACAIDFRADRVCVAADSAVYGDDGVHVAYGCKLYALPIARGALFFRGKLDVTLRTLMQLALASDRYRIEDVAEVLPTFLQESLDDWCVAVDQDPDEVGHLQEALLCGWSETEGRMRLWQYVNTDGFKMHETGKTYGGPWAWPPIPAEYVPPDRAADKVETKLVNTLTAIDRWAADHPEWKARLGGDMQMLTVTADSIAAKTIGKFPDPNAKAAPTPTANTKPGKAGKQKRRR